MKNLCKKISLLALITFGFQAANAQITYGVKAGAGTSNTTLIHGVSKNRIGFVGGGFAEIPLTYKNNLHYLQVEVLYTNQGEFSKFREGDKDKYKEENPEKARIWEENRKKANIFKNRIKEKKNRIKWAKAKGTKNGESS